MTEPNPENIAGWTGIIGVLVWMARKWWRQEKVSDSSANVSIAVNGAVQTLLDNQTKRLDEMDAHIVRIEKELSLSRQAHRDCEERYRLASNEIKDLRAKVEAFLKIDALDR